MTRSSTLALVLAAAATACSSIPSNLNPGPYESLAMTVPAKGVQIYECRANKEGGYGWTFVAPEAELFDASGYVAIGKHYGGPHWEAADGSKIVGKVRERADAPAADAIAWLLLEAKSVGPEGSFSNISSIQRVNTSGGAAPKDGCSQATVGRPAHVPYTADYHFFSSK
jgi:Protein of unknown function (DUF3455)